MDRDPPAVVPRRRVFARPVRLEGFAIHDLNDAGAPDGTAKSLQRALQRRHPRGYIGPKSDSRSVYGTEGRRFESCRARVVIAGNPAREAGLRPV